MHDDPLAETIQAIEAGGHRVSLQPSSHARGAGPGTTDANPQGSCVSIARRQSSQFLFIFRRTLVQKTASAKWSGGIKDGKGFISTQTGVLNEAPYGFKSRFEEGPGTNP